MDLLQSMRRTALVRSLQRRRHRRRFVSPSGYALHYGVYPTFDAARRDAPTSRGFDQPGAELDFTDRLTAIFPYDYPVLFWLDRAFRQGGRTVVDVGGSVGVHYFAYQPLLEYPAELRWRICEVPAAVAAGKALAAERGARALEFTSELSPAALEGADVLLSAGALQYIEAPRLEELLAGTRRRPAHLLLNKLPLHDGEEFVSLQHIREGFVPERVFDRARLVGALERLGYEAVAEWRVPERTFWLPGWPERSFGHFSGLYLRARGAA